MKWVAFKETETAQFFPDARPEDRLIRAFRNKIEEKQGSKVGAWVYKDGKWVCYAGGDACDEDQAVLTKLYTELRVS